MVEEQKRSRSSSNRLIRQEGVGDYMLTLDHVLIMVFFTTLVRPV